LPTKSGIIAVLFLLLLSAPMLAMTIKLDKLNRLDEKRELAKIPQLSLSANSLETFPKEYSKYFNDNFGLRSSLVFLNNAIKVLAFNTSTNNEVLIGKHNWLYFAADHNIDYYQNKKSFSYDELAYWNWALEAKQKWLSQRGIYYLLVIAPNKDTIYPEYMPDSIRKERGISLLDQLLKSLSLEMKHHVLDLREPLCEGKKECRVYYRTDTHWNQEGAYRVYSEIINNLNSRFPQMHPIPRSEFRISDGKQGGDLAGLLGLSTILTEESPSFVSKKAQEIRSLDIGYPVNEAWRPSVYESKDKSLPRLIVMHDSFGNSLLPFLSLNFSRTVSLQRSRLRFAMHFNTDEITRENPDVVIEEIAERRLYRFFPELPDEIMAK